MHILELFEKTCELALLMLGEYKHAYNDDGNEPQGSAWLPKEDIPDSFMEQVVQSGYGRIIDAYIWSDADIVAYLQQSKYITGGNGSFPLDEKLIEMFASERVCAHYGTIGTEGSVWICSDELPYLPDDPEERLKLWQLGQLFGVDITNEDEHEA